MRLKIKPVAIFLCVLYIAFTFYSAFKLITRGAVSESKIFPKSADEVPENTQSQHGANKQSVEKGDIDSLRKHLNTSQVSHLPDRQEVEIWSKAAIGLYLWQHIFEAEVEPRMNGVWSYGSKNIGRIQFRFRTGPGVVPEKVPSSVKHLVLVLNGREPSKVEFATAWLDSLPRYRYLERVAVVLLGNEQCENDWIRPYLKRHGGLVDLLFVVYDSPNVDNLTFYQWPLGVATYRNFPIAGATSDEADSIRPYRCNFLGTVYSNSSREVLLKVLGALDIREQCYVKPRTEWLPQETSETQADYLEALARSDLTLCPVGMNSETYRIYEAMAYGSVPVLEDLMTSGHCGQDASAPFRLLKKYNAPVIFVKDWDELPAILQKEKERTDSEIRERRRNVFKWYNFFKEQMRELFVDVLDERFFR